MNLRTGILVGLLLHLVECENSEPKHWSTRLLLVMGEQKCGTSYLHSLLATHPTIGQAMHPQPGRRKEHHFWNHKVRVPFSNYLKMYKARFRGFSLGLDSTPDYFDSTVTRERLRKYAPGSKMIILFRDPGQRAMSAWDQNRRAGWENRPFGRAVSDELQ